MSYATLEDIPSFTSAPRRAVVKGRSSSKRARRVDDVIMVLQRGVGELLVFEMRVEERSATWRLWWESETRDSTQSTM